MKRATVEDIKKHDWFKKVRLFVQKTYQMNIFMVQKNILTEPSRSEHGIITVFFSHFSLFNMLIY